MLGVGADFSHRTITKAGSALTSPGPETYIGKAAQKAFEQAGLGPKEMDIFEIYGSYPFANLSVLDSLGLFEPGTAGAIVEAGETSPGGKYPVSTNGEAMGCGHTGTGCGFAIFVESVRQLQGKAGKAQVEGAKFLIEDCGGGAFMDIHFTVMGNEIPG